MTIHGKVVAITGASSGIGEATARHLASLGAAVVLGARRTDRLDRLVAEIEAAGGAAAAARVDVTDPADLHSLVTLAVERFGQLDVLVGNAGISRLSPVADLDAEGWSAMVDVNVKGILHGIAAALPVFRRQGNGHLVTVLSVSGLKIVPTKRCTPERRTRCARSWRACGRRAPTDAADDIDLPRPGPHRVHRPSHRRSGLA